MFNFLDSIGGNRIRFQQQNGTLILNSVNLEDAGEYECVADNNESPRLSRVIQIKVNGKLQGKILTF